MKKSLLSLFFLLVASTANAGDRHHGHHRGGDRWVAPLVGGVILGALISRQNQDSIHDAPIYVTPPVSAPVIQYQTYPLTYNCMVRVYNPDTGVFYNQVMICVR